MIVSENKDFKYKSSDLTIKEGKEDISLLDLSFNEKVSALKIREKWIISNYKKIEDIKKSSDTGRSKEVSFYSFTNKNLRAELEKIKFSSIAQNQGIIYNTYEFQDYFKDLSITLKSKVTDEFLISDLLVSNPQLLLEKVSNYIKRLSTDQVMDFIKPIDNGFRTWWTTWYVNIHRDYFIYTLQY